MEEVTILIKTFLRPGILDKCIKSIKKFYPNIKILIADDGKTNEKDKRQDVISHYILPFDTGVSYGRNFLLDKVETKYIFLADDDTIFTEETKIELLLNVLENNDEIDIASIWNKPEKFWGKLEKNKNVLKKIMHQHTEIINGYKVYDFVPNLFLGRTDKIKKIRWDNDLKICEHLDFFWRAKQNNIKSVFLENISAVNHHTKNKEYSKYRDRVVKFQALQMKKIGVNKIITI